MLRTVMTSLFLICLMSTARGGETAVPEWVLSGIAAVETGSTYRSGQLVRYRNRRIGPAGEVGPWQLSPSVLRDLGAQHQRLRIRRDPALAEYYARLWLVRCYRRTGDWMTAVAIYHTGSKGDRRKGLDYAERVFAAGNA